MKLAQRVTLGTVLPHRSAGGLEVAEVRAAAVLADEAGFADIWVTENSLGPSQCLHPVVALSYAAAVTSRVRLGVAVSLLPVHHPIDVAHSFASLDQVSGGRAILGVGLGPVQRLTDHQVPVERRVRRLTESVDLIRAFWRDENVDYQGEVYRYRGPSIASRPVQRPGPPIWLGGMSPAAVRRAARLGDGWTASGFASSSDFGAAVPVLREAVRAVGRDADRFPISKRVFLAIDEKPERARRELRAWFDACYRNPDLADTSGLAGTGEQVLEGLVRLADMGANHLIVNPVNRYEQQIRELARLTGLS